MHVAERMKIALKKVATEKQQAAEAVSSHSISPTKETKSKLPFTANDAKSDVGAARMAAKMISVHGDEFVCDAKVPKFCSTKVIHILSPRPPTQPSHHTRSSHPLTTPSHLSPITHPCLITPTSIISCSQVICERVDVSVAYELAAREDLLFKSNPETAVKTILSRDVLHQLGSGREDEDDTSMSGSKPDYGGLHVVWKWRSIDPWKDFEVDTDTVATTVSSGAGGGVVGARTSPSSLATPGHSPPRKSLNKDTTDSTEHGSGSAGAAGAVVEPPTLPPVLLPPLSRHLPPTLSLPSFLSSSLPPSLPSSSPS